MTRRHNAEENPGPSDRGFLFQASVGVIDSVPPVAWE